MESCRTQCKPGVDVVRTQCGHRKEYELEICLFYILITSALRSINLYIFFVSVVDLVTWSDGGISLIFNNNNSLFFKHRGNFRYLKLANLCILYKIASCK